MKHLICLKPAVARSWHYVTILGSNSCLPSVTQAMYNHGTPRMITQLLTQWHSRPGTQLHTAAMQSSAMQLPPSNSNSALVYSGSDSAAASNNVAAEDMLPAATNSSTAAMIERLEASTPVGLSKPTLAAMQPASADAVLLQIPTVDCPSDTFGELFEQLLTEQCMICCGLYRSAVHEGRRLWYVMTNPDKVSRQSRQWLVSCVCKKLCMRIVAADLQARLTDSPMGDVLLSLLRDGNARKNRHVV